MLHKSFILFLLLLVSPFLPAQQNIGSSAAEYDYQKFKQTYNKTIKEDTLTRTDPVLHPASCPRFFSNIPESESNVMYTIGISDPEMERSSAIKLAIIRAKMIAAFMVFPEVGILADNYSNEELSRKSDEYASRYSDFFHLKSILPIDINSFQIETIEFTSFGEAVVLMSYSNPNDSTVGILLTEANIYQNERQKQDRFDAESKFDMNCVEKYTDSCFSSATYSVISLNNTSEIGTKIDNISLDFSYKNYRYINDSANVSNKEENPTGKKLTYGLWKAFAEGFLNKISQNSQNDAIDIKQVDDNYNEGKQTLSREMIKSQIKFQLSKVIVFDNRLSIELNPVN